MPKTLMCVLTDYTQLQTDVQALRDQIKVILAQSLGCAH